MSAVVAAACMSPTTLGTDTVAGPVETTRFTAEPLVPGKLNVRAINQRGDPVLTKSVAEYD